MVIIRVIEQVAACLAVEPTSAHHHSGEIVPKASKAQMS
jgi:hypothetical protein